MNFKQAALICNFISKDYAEKIFELIVTYKDISATEAASRLGMHIRTVQDFLDTMAVYDIVDKVEVFEKKRPYFRYSIKKKRITIDIDLQKEFSEETAHSNQLKIRENKNSDAKFSVARNGEYFSTVTLWIGKGRNLKERKIHLTISQGQFLYYLPFPDAEPLTVSEIMTKADVEEVHHGEILNIIDELINLGVIEKIY